MRPEKDYAAGVRAKYNRDDEIWGADDPWHAWSRRQIREELRLVRDEFEKDATGKPRRILDVGSAGEAYFESAADRVDVDVAERRLSGAGQAVCCSAERLALAARTVDLLICVGPVLNYCSFEESVAEMARVARDGCMLALHVELSNSWEFLGSGSWRRPVAFVESFYKGTERYWVYSDAFVRRTLKRYGFHMRRTRYFHCLSSLAYRVVKDPDLASRLAPCDRLLSKVPGCGAVADSAIYVCRLAT